MVIERDAGSLFWVTRECLPCLYYEREHQMKKVILISALFAIAGIASAQNTAPASASASAAKPAAAAETANSTETTPKAEHKKVHAKKHVKRVVRKSHKAKAASAETGAKADTAAPQNSASAPAK